MSEDRRARRRALIWGIPAFACLTAIAALVSIPRVEDDRGAAVLQSLADAGLTELTVDMAGRDAHISSSQTYPEGSNDVIRDLAVQWGVRKADIALLKPAAATATTTGDATSSSTSALTSGPTTSRARPAVPVIFAEIGRGEVTLRGSYANNRQHEELLASANTSYRRGNVVDQLRLAGLNEIAPSDGGVTALATALVATETDLVEGLVSFTESRLILEGIAADSAGRDRLNQQLSEERARAVRTALVRLGVPEARLIAVGFGESRPLGDNETEAGRQANRRVHFSVKS